MRRSLVFAVILLLGTACSRASIPSDELAVRIDSAAYEVRLGTPFPLTVTRSWSLDVEPEDWDDVVLAPLAVRAVGVGRGENDTHAIETRTFQAVASELGDVRVLPPLFVAQRGSDEIVVTGDALDVRVVSVLPAGDASDVEMPGGMLRARTPWGVFVAALGALAVVGLLLVRARRRPALEPAVAPEPAAPPVPPEDVASRALSEAESLSSDDDPRSLCDAVSDALRAYVTSRFGLGSLHSTTFELVRSARAADLPIAASLARVLTRCDLVRFARLPLRGAERSELLGAARRVVSGTPTEDAS